MKEKISPVVAFLKQRRNTVLTLLFLLMLPVVLVAVRYQQQTSTRAAGVNGRVIVFDPGTITENPGVADTSNPALPGVVSSQIVTLQIEFPDWNLSQSNARPSLASEVKQQLHTFFSFVSHVHAQSAVDFTPCTDNGLIYCDAEGQPKQKYAYRDKNGQCPAENYTIVDASAKASCDGPNVTPTIVQSCADDGLVYCDANNDVVQKRPRWNGQSCEYSYETGSILRLGMKCDGSLSGSGNAQRGLVNQVPGGGGGAANGTCCTANSECASGFCDLQTVGNVPGTPQQLCPSQGKGFCAVGQGQSQPVITPTVGPTNPPGQRRVGDVCSDSFPCAPGLACVRVGNGPNEKECRESQSSFPTPEPSYTHRVYIDAVNGEVDANASTLFTDSSRYDVFSFIKEESDRYVTQRFLVHAFPLPKHDPNNNNDVKTLAVRFCPYSLTPDPQDGRCRRMALKLTIRNIQTLPPPLPLNDRVLNRVQELADRLGIEMTIQTDGSFVMKRREPQPGQPPESIYKFPRLIDYRTEDLEFLVHVLMTSYGKHPYYELCPIFNNAPVEDWKRFHDVLTKYGVDAPTLPAQWTSAQLQALNDPLYRDVNGSLLKDGVGPLPLPCNIRSPLINQIFSYTNNPNLEARNQLLAGNTGLAFPDTFLSDPKELKLHEDKLSGIILFEQLTWVAADIQLAQGVKWAVAMAEMMPITLPHSTLAQVWKYILPGETIEKALALRDRGAPIGFTVANYGQAIIGNFALLVAPVGLTGSLEGQVGGRVATRLVGQNIEREEASILLTSIAKDANNAERLVVVTSDSVVDDPMLNAIKNIVDQGRRFTLWATGKRWGKIVKEVAEKRDIYAGPYLNENEYAERFFAEDITHLIRQGKTPKAIVINKEYGRELVIEWYRRLTQLDGGEYVRSGVVVPLEDLLENVERGWITTARDYEIRKLIGGDAVGGFASGRLMVLGESTALDLAENRSRSGFNGIFAHEQLHVHGREYSKYKYTDTQKWREYTLRIGPTQGKVFSLSTRDSNLWDEIMRAVTEIYTEDVRIAMGATRGAGAGNVYSQSFPLVTLSIKRVFRDILKQTERNGKRVVTEKDLRELAITMDQYEFAWKLDQAGISPQDLVNKFRLAVKVDTAWQNTLSFITFRNDILKTTLFYGNLEVGYVIYQYNRQLYDAYINAFLNDVSNLAPYVIITTPLLINHDECLLVDQSQCQ